MWLISYVPKLIRAKVPAQPAYLHAVPGNEEDICRMTKAGYGLRLRALLHMRNPNSMINLREKAKQFSSS
jgi:hypothetical protein